MSRALFSRGRFPRPHVLLACLRGTGEAVGKVAMVEEKSSGQTAQGGKAMIYKRGNVCWTRFGVDGEMFCKSLHTGYWREAKREEKKKIADAHAGKITPSSVPFARMPFKEALELYRRDRAPNLAATTRRSELDHSKPLEVFFGDARLHTITEEMIRDYIAARTRPGGPTRRSTRNSTSSGGC